MRRAHAVTLLLFAATLLLFAASGACDPVRSVSGDVRTIPDSAPGKGAVYASGAPIRGALATYVCGTSRVRLGHTDERGHFEFVGTGWLDRGCAVEVSADGYYPERVEVGDLCLQWEGDACHALRVDVELVPRSARRDESH